MNLPSNGKANMARIRARLKAIRVIEQENKLIREHNARMEKTIANCVDCSNTNNGPCKKHDGSF